MPLVLGLLAAILGVRASESEAATPSNGYTNILFDNGDGHDLFTNYDFQSVPGTTDNASMPIGLIFFNNAEVDKLKQIFFGAYGVGPPYASENHAYVQDAPGGALYDADHGMKTGIGACYGDVYHYRLYADGDDRMYDVDWGYFVVGTTHIDRNEICQPSYGHSEYAEGKLARYWFERGYRHANDAINFSNYEPYRIDGNHVWNNDGWATAFCVPAGRLMDDDSGGVFGCNEWDGSIR
ncbi:MAG: hypothetical protein H0U12_06930 [Thermoleophilaceae bacterium]|nr:hypothetical protein [Thermoleophilaceae bacterium]